MDSSMEDMIKEKILDSLIDNMDERMVDGLKQKSPKFAKVDVKTNDPMMAEDIKKKLMSDVPSVSEVPDKCDEEDEDLKKLIEMYKNLK